jgi:hypothetical protein
MAEYAEFSNLPKSHTVIEMLVRLEQRFGRGGFQIVDHWDADLDAVGIAHPSNQELLAYIAVHGSEDYYVELELPCSAGSALPYSVAGEYRSVTFDRVAARFSLRQLSRGSQCFGGFRTTGS